VAPAQTVHAEPFSITVEPDRDEVVVVAAGELDILSSPALVSEARELRASGFRRVVLDLRKVSFVDSTGLRALLELRRDAEVDGEDLTLVDGSPAVSHIVDLTATRDRFAWR
jgi:anti-anti-sigma factor